MAIYFQTLLRNEVLRIIALRCAHAHAQTTVAVLDNYITVDLPIKKNKLFSTLLEIQLYPHNRQ